MAGLDANRDLTGYSFGDSQNRATNEQPTKAGTATNATKGQVQSTAKSSGQTGNQPATVWMSSSDGTLRRVPVGQYQFWLKRNYALAVPVIGPNGDHHYVSASQLEDYIRAGYQVGRRVQLGGKNGKEIIVPNEDAGQNVPKGAKLLPLTDDEASMMKRAGGIPRNGPPTPWKPGEVEMAEMTVPGANKKTVEQYLPYIADALQKKFGANAWQDYLPTALGIITAESSNFVPRTQAGAGANDMRFGHGWVQLSNRFNFAQMNKELGLAGTKDDIVKHPEKANHPAIAARILAQYIFDHQQEGDVVAKNGQKFHHFGLQRLREANKQEIKPDPQEALALYIRWLKNDYLPWTKTPKNYEDELKQRRAKDRNATTTTAALLNNIYVQDRLAINTGHFQNTPFEGLPKGLERFLPAVTFVRKQDDIAKNFYTLTLKDVADRWVKGVEEFGDKDFARTLSKRLKFPEGTDLSKIKLSQLPLEMRNQMILAQHAYEQQVVHSLEQLASPAKSHTSKQHSKKH